MSRLNTCSHGHRWEASASNPPAAGECPVCAASTPSKIATVHDQGEMSALATLTFAREQNAARSRPALPTVPGYQIDEELGHGGMGVVYRAWQISLKRHVALKMILAAEHADDTHLARFRTEAQAVAQLQHPNIVQIYEVGDFQGRPYFCLEYVAGGSLAKHLVHQPQPADLAARIVETLARAIHYTHQRGIVHRDLKPANILLQIGDSHGQQTSAATAAPLAAAIPKITDFGLAKQLQSDSAQTLSGAVLGTPSYMAPEQAAGRTHAIGPPADVYALGAILYEMLTGRPPFRGDSQVETLRQVEHDEPVPPSRLQARLPRDLETICLKALAKEPERRYSSALALAQDLERFGAGEPILARREGPVRLLLRKVRRHRVTVLSLCAVVLALGAAGLFVSEFLETRRVRLAAAHFDELKKNFDASLQKIAWTGAYLDKVNGQIDAMAELDATRAEEARAELYRRLEQSIRHDLRQDVNLRPEDIERVQQALALLGTRRPDLAASLDKALSKRTGELQTVAVLAPPFANVEDVFPIKLQATATHVVSPRRGDRPDKALVLLKDVCQGSVRIEATFAFPSWTKTPQLGLGLNAVSEQRPGYAFFIGTLDSAGDVPGKAKPSPRATPAERLSLGAALAKKSRIVLRIERNGVALRQEMLAADKLGNKPLTLRAAREGNQLSVEVLQEKVLLGSLRFQDMLAASSAAPGVFCLYWSEGDLQRLHLSRQTLPALPGPLDEANLLFARGEVDKALILFGEQAEHAAEAQVRQEARCKKGLCLRALKLSNEAAAELAALVHEKGEPWPLLATCELWLLYLQQNKRAEADDVADTLLSRGYRPEQLAAVIADEVRNSIWGLTKEEFSPFSFLLRGTAKRLRSLERMVALHDYFGENEGDQFNFRYRLVRAYRILGQTGKAESVLVPWLRQFNVCVAHQEFHRAMYLEELAWISRDLGHPESAIVEIDQYLAALPPNLHAYGNRLLAERARLLVALDKWDEAEKDLSRYFAFVQQEPDEHQFFSAACLLRGFLRQRRQDEAGAQAAWRTPIATGSHKSQPLWEPALVRGGGVGTMQAVVLGALTNQLTDEQAWQLQERLIAEFVPNYRAAINSIGLRLPADLVRKMWRTRRGMDSARHIAYQDVPLADYLKLPVQVAASSLMARDAFGDKLSGEDEDLLWRLAEDVWLAMRQEKLTQVQMVQLALTWKGTTNFLGWSGLAPSLDPRLRGPLAYVMGHRYQRLGQSQQAANFFQSALRDAGTDAILQRLVQAAQAELKKKTP